MKGRLKIGNNPSPLNIFLNPSHPTLDIFLDIFELIIFEASSLHTWGLLLGFTNLLTREGGKIYKFPRGSIIW